MPSFAAITRITLILRAMPDMPPLSPDADYFRHFAYARAFDYAYAEAIVITPYADVAAAARLCR